MKIKIAVCDDEPDQLAHISSLIRNWEMESGRRCEIRSFLSAEAFWFSYVEEKDYDLLLLDIEMGGMSGTELARKIRSGSGREEIIFITSYFEFFGDGYEVDALHYLIKPVSGEKLLPVLEKAAERLKQEPPSLIITFGGETLRLYEADILYAEAFLHYIVIHAGKGEYRLKQSLSAFSLRLSSDFYRAHRSYLVSLRHLAKISRTALLLDNGVEIPLARGRYDSISRAFIEWGG